MTLDPEQLQTTRQQALDLANQLRTLAAAALPEHQSTWAEYVGSVQEVVQFLESDGSRPLPKRAGAPLTQAQMQQFGKLLRDRRNAAGLSRVQLARRAKISDATIKFTETARHPPSRATLLRLIGVEELNLRWADTPGYSVGTTPAVAEMELASQAAELFRFDSRLTVPMVLELLLVLDELRASQHAIEVTSYGSRRVCCFCGARSEAWAVDAREAAKLPIRHAAPCGGRLVDSLWQRFPVIAELAQHERRSLRSPTATALDACLRELTRERIYGCRSGAELAAQLARGAALPPTPYRVGVGATLLWALALGPCPIEPTTKTFSEHRTQQLARLVSKCGLPSLKAASRLRGVAEAAAWLIDPHAPDPYEPPIHGPDTPTEGDAGDAPRQNSVTHGKK